MENQSSQVNALNLKIWKIIKVCQNLLEVA